MITYFLKWSIASLLMPLGVFLFGNLLNYNLVFIFWPGSIVLMSLGAEERPFADVIYIWVVAVGLNILLYLLIGLILYLLLEMNKKKGVKSESN